MPDKKLTDNEIIKALECCVNNTDRDCHNCPFSNCDRSCVDELELNALDLINRKNAENERLKAKVNHYNYCYENFVNTPISRIKAEAYKECIDKIKEETNEALKSNYKARSERIEKHNVGETDEFISYCQGKIDCLRGIDDFLDDILNETKGQ